MPNRSKLFRDIKMSGEKSKLVLANIRFRILWLFKQTVSPIVITNLQAIIKNHARNVLWNKETKNGD